MNIFKNTIPVTDRQEKLAKWSLGFAAYMAGAPLDVLHDATERRGWWAALDADAYCGVQDYQAQQRKVLTDAECAAENEAHERELADERTTQGIMQGWW